MLITYSTIGIRTFRSRRTEEEALKVAAEREDPGAVLASLCEDDSPHVERMGLSAGVALP